MKLQLVRTPAGKFWVRDPQTGQRLSPEQPSRDAAIEWARKHLDSAPARMLWALRAGAMDASSR